MKLTFNHPTGGTKEIEVKEESTAYRSIKDGNKLMLSWDSEEPINIPLGSTVEVEGYTYTLYYPVECKKVNTKWYEYQATLHGKEEELKFIKIKDIGDKKPSLKFVLTGKPTDFVRFVAKSMGKGWKVGQVIDGVEKTIAFNHEYCGDALGRVCEEYNTEFRVEGKTIHLHKLELNKEQPLQLSYGMGKGFRSGIVVRPDSERSHIGRLFVSGGERNINPSEYGATSLQLPKSATFEYEGYTYSTDETGSFIKGRDFAISQVEESYDGSEVYPRRVGKVTKVETTKEGFVDVLDSSIPEDLNYNDFRIPGEKAVIVFLTGMLAGREFELTQNKDALTGYKHEERRFQLITAEQDGMMMPGGSYMPAVGDEYAVFGISLPKKYIEEAEAELFHEAVKYLHTLEGSPFKFEGELDPAFAHAKWLEIGGMIVPGSYIRFSDPDIYPAGEDIRITAVEFKLSKPWAAELTLTNATERGYLGTQLGKLQAEGVLREHERKAMQRAQRQDYRQALEALNMVEKAVTNMEGFTERIKPSIIETMGLLIGSEASQFGFVRAVGSLEVDTPAINYNPSTKRLTITKGVIRHQTIGITSLKNNRKPSEYRYWKLPAYTSPALTDEGKSYYIYAKVSRTTLSGNYLLSEEPITMEQDSEYYHLLVGTLSSIVDGDRAYNRLYGYTKVGPGSMVVDTISSANGKMTINLETGEIFSDAIRFRRPDTQEETNLIDYIDEVDTHHPIIKNGTWWRWDGTQYVDTGEPARGADGRDGKDGLQGLQGEDGKDGIPGRDGKDGKTQYTHIAYADTANGGGFSQSPTGKAYIGMYVDFVATDSSDPKKYKWSLIKGADGSDGIAGKAGKDGRTPYLHIAYANSSDGRQGFSVTDSQGKYFIGQYTDYTQADSTDPTSYKWTLIKGKDGRDGKDGSDGIAGKDGKGITSTSIAYAINSSDKTAPSSGWSGQVPSLEKGRYLWTRTTWRYTDGSTETGYSVTYIAKDGNNGKDGIAGKDGTRITSTIIRYAKSANGTTAPTSGWQEQVPAVPAGQYLWTRTTWKYSDGTDESGYTVAKMGSDGKDGDKGDKGDDGKDGTRIVSITEEFYLSTSKEETKGGSWTTTPPTWQMGKYIWTRSRIKYENPTSEETTTPIVSSEWEAVNDVKIGGRNLLTSEFLADKELSSGATIIKESSKQRGYRIFNNLPLEEGEYIVSLKAKINSDRQVARVRLSYDNGRASINYYPPIGGWKKDEWVTFAIPLVAPKEGYSLTAQMYNHSFTDDIEEVIEYGFVKVERGNKATDWTEAPEDIEDRRKKEIEALNTSISNANKATTDLNEYVDGAFRDGIVSDAEAVAIEKYINVVQTEKEGLEATYNKLYANPYLKGTAKSELLNAKVTYFGAVDNLLASINTAIQDGKATQQEKQDVDRKYSLYKTAFADLKKAVEEANKAIQVEVERVTKGYADEIVSIKDTRGDNQPPSWYRRNYAYKIVREFKHCRVVGISGEGTYCTLATTVRWGNTSGGPVEQEATTDSGKVYRRVGNSNDTDWLEWSSLDLELKKANQATTDLKIYVDGAFKDGIITEQEATQIKSYINVVNTEWAGVLARYEKLYNSNLTNAQALLNAKISCAGAVENLTSYITSAISDGVATSAEGKEVDRRYNLYKDAFAELNKQLEIAINNKVEEIEVGTVNLLPQSAISKTNSRPYSISITNPKKGDNYILSVLVKTTSRDNVSSPRTTFYLTRGSERLIGRWLTWGDEYKSGEWVEYLAEIKIDKHYTGNLTLSGWLTDYGSVSNRAISGDNQTIFIKEAAIYKGNKKPASWVPAIEDIISDTQKGMRNLILDSKEPRRMKGEATRYYLSKGLQSGVYRLSFDIEVITPPIGDKFRIFFAQGSDQTKTIFQVYKEGATHYSFTFLVNVSSDEKRSILLYPNERYENSATVGVGEAIFSNVMLTEGDAPHEYREAPEDVDKRVQELKTGLSNANTLISSLEDITQQLKDGSMSREQVTGLENILHALNQGKTTIAGGLMLTKSILMSNETDDITTAISGYDEGGGVAFEAGIKNYKQTNHSSRVVINHDGSARFGDMYINTEKEDVVKFIGKDANGTPHEYLKLGGKAPTESYMNDANTEIREFPISGVSLNRQGSIFIDRWESIESNRQVRYEMDVTATATAISVRSEYEVNPNEQYYAPASANCNSTIEVIVKDRLNGSQVWRTTSSTVSASAYARGGSIRYDEIIDPTDMMNRKSNTSRISITVPASVIKKGYVIEVSLRVSGSSTTSTPSNFIGSTGVGKKFIPYDKSKPFIALAKDRIAFFFGRQRQILLNYASDWLMKVVGNVLVQGTVKADIVEANEWRGSGAVLAGAEFDKDGKEQKSFGRYKNRQDSNTAYAFYSYNGSYYTVYHSIPHSNYVPMLTVNESDWADMPSVSNVNAYKFRVTFNNYKGHSDKYAFSYVAFQAT